jgi:hypothetical protein
MDVQHAMKTREEHLAWCKQRALEYIDSGQVTYGLMSMLSDMSKHPETNTPGLYRTMAGLIEIGDLRTPEAARKHINGYN